MTDPAIPTTRCAARVPGPWKSLSVDSRRSAAAANNAEWCDAVCRARGAATRVDPDAWTCSTRTPPYYPDAVTLVPEPSVPALLSRIDCTPGCSVKDSFASVDLTEHGFKVLFEAEWIFRPNTTASITDSHLAWSLVRDPAELCAWEAVWRGDDGPIGIFDLSLIENDAIALLAERRGGRVVAGAVLNRSSTVVGISNYFSEPSRDARRSWSGCVSFAATLSKSLPLVGYESGDRLAAAHSEGFVSIGALRIWQLSG